MSVNPLVYSAAGYDNSTSNNLMRGADLKRVSDIVIVDYVSRARSGYFAAHQWEGEEADTLAVGCSLGYRIFRDDCDTLPQDQFVNADQATRINFDLDYRELQVCQGMKIRHKLAYEDIYKWQRTGLLGLYEAGMNLALTRKINRRVEPYFFSVLAASAAQGNQLTNGGSGYNPNTAAGVEKMFQDLIQHLMCLGVIDDFNDTEYNITIGVPSCIYGGLLAYAKENLGGCCPQDIRYTGLTKVPAMGLEIVHAPHLPRDNAGRFLAVWARRDFVARPFNWFQPLDWYDNEGDKYLVGKLAFDAHVLLDKAVGTLLIQP